MPSIAVIAGDGVGKEVIPVGLRVLEAVASLDVEMLPWGAEHYAATGVMMPGDALARLDSHDAIYLGAVAGRRCRTTSACGGCCCRSARRSSSTSTSGRSSCSPE